VADSRPAYSVGSGGAVHLGIREASVIAHFFPSELTPLDEARGYAMCMIVNAETDLSAHYWQQAVRAVPQERIRLTEDEEAQMCESLQVLRRDWN
jgi:hypothetical protein